VGYGDFTPTSVYGRLVGMVCCFCGIYLLSLMIVSLVNFLNLTEDETTVNIFFT